MCAVLPQIHLTKEPFSPQGKPWDTFWEEFHCRPFSLLAPRKLLFPFEAVTEEPHLSESWYIYTPPRSGVLVFYFCFAVHIFFLVQDASEAVWK